MVGNSIRKRGTKQKTLYNKWVPSKGIIIGKKPHALILEIGFLPKNPKKSGYISKKTIITTKSFEEIGKFFDKKDVCSIKILGENLTKEDYIKAMKKIKE